jgi:hypothetical protein
VRESCGETKSLLARRRTGGPSFRARLVAFTQALTWKYYKDVERTTAGALAWECEDGGSGRGGWCRKMAETASKREGKERSLRRGGFWLLASGSERCKVGGTGGVVETS